MQKTPINQIKKELKEILDKSELDKIPKKWEKIGNVGIIKLDPSLEKYKIEIAKVYSNCLNCKSIINDKKGIIGNLREPDFEFLYGDSNTETTHIENQIKYVLDPQKIMFSSGNMSERLRMANISNKDEIVADLFAGIGYFSIPIAVYSRPKKIYSIEKNPIAYDYLTKNISLNKVNDIVEPVLGDNRIKTPQNIADRVVMGYIGNTKRYLKIALNCLINNCGIIHFHDKFSSKVVPDGPFKQVSKIALSFGRKAELLKIEKVKSFAPGIYHYVFDISIDDL